MPTQQLHQVTGLSRWRSTSTRHHAEIGDDSERERTARQLKSVEVVLAVMKRMVFISPQTPQRHHHNGCKAPGSAGCGGQYSATESRSAWA